MKKLKKKKERKKYDIYLSCNGNFIGIRIINLKKNKFFFHIFIINDILFQIICIFFYFLNEFLH